MEHLLQTVVWWQLDKRHLRLEEVEEEGNEALWVQTHGWEAKTENTIQ